MRYWMPLLAAVICLLGLTMTVGTYAAAEVPAATQTVQVAQLDARLMATGALGSDAGMAAPSPDGSNPDEENHPGLLIAAGLLALWSLRRRLV